MGGSGGIGWHWENPKVELLGDATAELAGHLDISLAGCQWPQLTPSWSFALNGRAGVGVPVVQFVGVVIPPAMPVIDGLLVVPIVTDVVGAIKVRVFFIFGGEISGEYENFTTGDCFLGSTSLNASLTAGVEAQSVVELFGAEAGVYIGGTGTPEFEICPDLEFKQVTARVYVGAYGYALGYEYKNEIGAEIVFDNGGQMEMLNVVPLANSPTNGIWQPIGSDVVRWGNSNRLVGVQVRTQDASESGIESEATIEQVLIENVTKMATPALVADAAETHIAYAAFDPAKPWYGATDIATVLSAGGGPWSYLQVTDDTNGEFAQRMAAADASTNVAAWSRVDGDVSGATGPGDIAPHLEIVAARYDRGGGTWATPVQLTSNSVVDRDPQPVVFGANEGILWVQNQAGSSPGDATNGDSLLYAAWNGSSYDLPQTLWTAQKGILSVAFAADATGEAMVIFTVDQDGDPETRTDRELYGAFTAGGVWQTVNRVTYDTVEDAVPVLVDAGVDMLCVWSADGVVNYSPLASWAPQATYAEYTTANEAMSLDAVSLPSGAAIAYTVQGESGMDIVASFYDAVLDTWSLPRQLTSDEHAESALALACDGSDLVIAYLKTQTERNTVDVEIEGTIHTIENVPQPARTDLYMLRHTLGNDLAIEADSLVVEPSNPTPGSAVIVRATVENRGDLPVENAEVGFYDGDPGGGGTLIDSIQVVPELLTGGASRDVTVQWSIPVSGSTGQVYVVADPSLVLDDRDRNNNTVTDTVMLPDLTIETGWYDDISGDSVALVARVSNAGAFESDASVLSWRLGDAEGPELGTASLEAMSAGAVVESAWVWNTQGFTPGEFVQVVAVSDNTDLVQEWDETNNIMSMSVRIPMRSANLNGDNGVDLVDYALLTAEWGATSCSEPDWCNGADLDHDGIVGTGDVEVLHKQWLIGK